MAAPLSILRQARVCTPRPPRRVAFGAAALAPRPPLEVLDRVRQVDVAGSRHSAAPPRERLRPGRRRAPPRCPLGRPAARRPASAPPSPDRRRRPSASRPSTTDSRGSRRRPDGRVPSERLAGTNSAAVFVWVAMPRTTPATYGQLHVCWAEDEKAAKQLALKQCPNSALSGSFFLELPLAEALDEEDVAESIICGPDPERHRAAIQEYVDAGYDHVYIHQVGPDPRRLLRLLRA